MRALLVLLGVGLGLPRPVGAVDVRLPDDVKAFPGDTLSVSLLVDDAIGIAGADITLSFDADIIEYLGVDEASLPEGFYRADTLVVNEVRLTLASATGITSERPGLAELAFKVIADGGRTTVVSLQRVALFGENAENLPAAIAGAMSVAVLGHAGDFTGDQRIDFEDVSIFLTAWVNSDLVIDIGPASGTVPYLVPELDGVLDFEDLMVLVQMWNWSAGAFIPAAKASGGPAGPGRLRIASQPMEDGIRLDLHATPAPLLAVGLEITYDPLAWRLTRAIPGDAFPDPSGVLLLQREHAPGQLLLQLGSLSGPTAAGAALAQLFFAPVGRGSDEVKVTYDLRGIEGVRHGSGLVTHAPRRIAEGFVLAPNVPNPFNPRTEIPYRLAAPAEVDLRVYDELGRRVATLVNSQAQPEGQHRVVWNGADGEGRGTSCGIYLCRLVARPTDGSAPIVKMRRMLLLR